MNQDDALKGELEDIVAGLQDYLLNVKRKAEAQQVRMRLWVEITEVYRLKLFFFANSR